jgi:hypothetical protein
MNGKLDRNSWFDKQLLAVTSTGVRSVNETLLPSLADG